MDARQKNLFGSEPLPWELDAAQDLWTASIVFPDAPHGPFDYLVPDAMRSLLQPGMRVQVPLGRSNRGVLGYCRAVGNPLDALHGDSHSLPSPDRLKPVLEVVDDQPLLAQDLLRLAERLAAYYLVHVGQVFEAMVPAAVRSQAGTRELTLLEVPNHVLAKLTQLKLPPKQRLALTTLASADNGLTIQQLAERAGCTISPINSLRKKGLVRETKQRVATHELARKSVERAASLELNSMQQAALDRLIQAIHDEKHQSFLLHGITGSGKTEVYIQAIEEVIRFGRQAIVLVPEISLTPQTRRRFSERFNQVAVLHSHLSPAERHHHWQRIAAGEVQVVVGARSAVFAPLPRLGLIILDEEHDPSFKQDNAPRYHARWVALERARDRKVPVVLGSATPSLETWHETQMGRHERLSLPRRVLDLPLPDVRLVDLSVEFRQRRAGGMISRPLQGAIRESLREQGQVILLLNRRGFARHIQCPSCGAAVRCPDCDIALTHHRDGKQAICHYCDYRRPTPNACPECDFEGIRYSGFGTQRLEEEVAKRFPNATSLRMDSDSMQKHGSHEKALDSFRHGEIDILLGTQMIAKGLDFPNVTLVGVVNADTSLHFPDFRAAERTFSLVTQVAGRSGRGGKGGRVLVQTLSPEHPAIVHAAGHDYVSFAETELEERREFGYPPVGRLARFVFRGESQPLTHAFAEGVAGLVQQAVNDLIPTNQLEEENAVRILGPVEATIAKIRNRFRYHALVFAPPQIELQSVLAKAIEQFPRSRDVEWIVDIDPLEML